MRILHLADLHLGWEPPFAEHANQYYKAWRDNFLQRLAAQLSTSGERPDLLVIAGDLFDRHDPQESLVDATIASLRRIQDLGVALVTLPGNHDELTYADSVYRRHERNWPGLLLNNTRPEDPTPLVVGGGRVYLTALAYDSREGISRIKLDRLPSRQSEAPHLALLHGSLNPAPKERCFALDGPALLSCGYDYIALGHEHSPAEHRGLKGNLMAYPGLAEPLGFATDNGETGGDGLCFVEILRGSSPRLWRSPLYEPSPLRYLEQDCSNFGGLFELHHFIQQNANPTALLKLSLRGELTFRLSLRQLLWEYRGSFAHLELDTSQLRPSQSLLKSLAEERNHRAALAREVLRDPTLAPALFLSLDTLDYARSEISL